MRCTQTLSVAAFLAASLATACAGAGSIGVDLCPVGSLSPSDTATSLPATLTNSPVGSTFYLEVWTTDEVIPPLGVASGFLDIAYNSAKVNATALSNGSTYTTLDSGSIDNTAGTILDLGGDALGVGTPGKNDWARLGWIEYTSTTPGSVTFTPEPSTLDVFSRYSAGSVPWTQVDAPTASITVTPTPEPSSFVLLAAGAVGAAAVVFLKRRRNRVSVRGGL